MGADAYFGRNTLMRSLMGRPLTATPRPAIILYMKTIAEKVAEMRHRAKEHEIPFRLTGKELSAVLAAFGGRCGYCGVELDSLGFDHAMPLSRGGGNEIGNIVPCCYRCNVRKRDRTPLEWFVLFAAGGNLAAQLAEASVAYRKCSTCHKMLPASSFHRKTTGPGLNKIASRCKPCQSAYIKQWRRQNWATVYAKKRAYVIANAGKNRVYQREWARRKREAARLLSGQK